MTEAEWLACAEPVRMLDFLETGNKVSNHKLTLLAASGLRSSPIYPGREREVLIRLETAERFADGRVSISEKSLGRTTLMARKTGCVGRNIDGW
jgi:hypothetical protein